MRWMIVISVTIIGAVGQARADARIDQFVKGYTNEQTSCRIHEAGVAKILDGATMLLEHSSEDGLAADVENLHAAHETVASYCTALASAIDFLKADPSASYKSLEKQIGEHDSHIRTLRASSKKALADTEPLIQKWITKINNARIEGDKATAPKPPGYGAKPDTKPADTKPADTKPADTKPADTKSVAVARPPVLPTKPVDDTKPTPKPEPVATPRSARFPSGHSVKLPALGGAWTVTGDAATDIADYVENGTHTSVTAEKYTGVSCNAQLVRLQAKSYGRQAAKEQTRPGQAWQVRLAGDAPAIVACASTRTGSALVTFDATDGLHPDLSELAWTMLASFAK
jgi:hypothetical protein